MNKKGNVSLFIMFMFIALIVITISAFFAPMGIKFNTAMYAAGEKIMEDSLDDINDIQNETVRNRVKSVIQGGLDAGENNIEVNNTLFQYGWVLVIGLTALILFLYSRQLVEVGGGLV
jgi:uncharacterized protein (UPF0333 family)